jgi:hypothetical protein
MNSLIPIVKAMNDWLKKKLLVSMVYSDITFGAEWGSEIDLLSRPMK